MEFQRDITDRQRVRLILADLARGNAAYECAKRDHSADAGSGSAHKLAQAKTALLNLQAEARRIVEGVGYYRDRERLAAMLAVRWGWLLTVALPV